MAVAGISWTVLSYANHFAHHYRQITTPAPRHSIFTRRMLFLTPNQQYRSTEGLPEDGQNYQRFFQLLPRRTVAKWSATNTTASRLRTDQCRVQRWSSADQVAAGEHLSDCTCQSFASVAPQTRPTSSTRNITPRLHDTAGCPTG